MSDPLVQILESIDSAFTSGLAATLAGMTLTAASLLSTLVKNQGDKVKETREKELALKSQAAAETDPADRRNLEQTAAAASTKYQVALKGHTEVKNAFQALLIGFTAFAFNLLSSLTLDPNVEKSILAAVGTPQGLGGLVDASNYAIWLSVDVAAALGSLGIGLSAICFAALTMSRVVPKL